MLSTPNLATCLRSTKPAAAYQLWLTNYGLPTPVQTRNIEHVIQRMAESDVEHVLEIMKACFVEQWEFGRQECQENMHYELSGLGVLGMA